MLPDFYEILFLKTVIYVLRRLDYSYKVNGVNGFLISENKVFHD